MMLGDDGCHEQVKKVMVHEFITEERPYYTARMLLMIMLSQMPSILMIFSLTT